ncbi:MAG: hypothetical protein ABJE95_05375 [Byssovorax sp.]
MPGALPHDPAAIPLPRPLPSSGVYAGGIALVMFSTCVCLVAHFSPGGLLGILAGGFLIFLDLRRRALGNISQILAASFRAVTLGRLADADRLLDEADKDRDSWGRRIADVQRAIVHLRRGDAARACARLDAALARPLQRYARENALYQIEAAHALRAFARASLCDAEGARRDIAAVRSRPGVSAESLARASLAEAIVLERTGGRDALRALLDRDKGLLLESCHPRERAIVRAYQRMVRVTTTTAYRAAPPRDEQEHRGDEPLLLDWVARIAPGAAAFVRAPRAQTWPAGPRVQLLPEVRAGAHRDLMRSRADTAATVGKRSNRLRLLTLAAGVSAALIGLVAVIATLIAAMPHPRGFDVAVDPTVPAAVGAIPLLPIALFALATALGVAGFRVSRRVRHASDGERSRLGVARDAIGRGDLSAASTALQGLEVREHDRLAAHASALQATIAERRCDAEAMLDAASTGLGRLARVPPSDAAMLQPELVAQRALALTLLDRGAEAAAELNVLAQRTSPMRERDLFRVRLIGLARAGNLAEAARWVEQESGDLPLGARDELLADLVRAAAAPDSAGLGEVERLEHELRTEPEIRRWIEWTAPRVLRAFRSTNEGDPGAEEGAARPLRVASTGPELPSDHQRARDAEAEAEAAGEAEWSASAVGARREA